jgi:hypothetical protein
MENPQISRTAFEPITLQRPMKLFKGALTQSKSFGTPFVPDPDFLVRLTTDYRSHQAILRENAGEHFKNLDNYLRQRHQPSSVTLLTMSQKIGVSTEDMASWVHGNEDGPLLPQLLDLFALFENVPYRIAAHTMDTEVLCPCCQANILDDRDVFWRKQDIAFGQPEYVFADRLLYAAIGATHMCQLLLRFNGHRIDWTDFFALADPDRHPIGNWLAGIQKARNLGSLVDMAIEMQQMKEEICQVPYERLRKWSAGTDLMPVAVAKVLSRAMNDKNRYLLPGYIARALAFVIDFLVAAAPAPVPKRVRIQKIVTERFAGVGKNFRIALAKPGTELRVSRWGE